MRDPIDRKTTPVTPNTPEDDLPLETRPGDGDAPMGGPLPDGARTSINPDDSPPESPLWPIPPDDPAPERRD
jgi:hypothetical protein